MSTTQEYLWQTLLDLTRVKQVPLPAESDRTPDRKITTDQQQSISSAPSQENHGSLLSRLPDELIEKLGEVMVTFDRLYSEREQLAEELLTSYNHLNAAFDAIVAVARCTDFQQAREVLIVAIANVIGSSYSYYFDNQAQGDLSPTDSGGNDGKITVKASDGEDISNAHEFLREHKKELEQLLGSGDTTQVVMIDYQGEYSPDHEGRGNVLVVRLKSDEVDGPDDSVNPPDTITAKPANHDATAKNPLTWRKSLVSLKDLGTLIFVRTAKQQPFMAVEMSLADTLGRMGSAVLGNIIYSGKIHRLYMQTIMSLVRATEAKDEYTSGHSVRVAEMACELAQYISLTPEDMERLELAGQLHDIGKIGIRDDVLTKPGRLTDEEFAHIKTHPVKSYKVLEPIEALHSVLPAVRHHHEHYDGSGYPDGLAGDDIPLHARILQIADVWDALTSTRSYRSAMSAEKAKGIMQAEAGTIMDPELVGSFLEMLEKRT